MWLLAHRNRHHHCTPGMIRRAKLRGSSQIFLPSVSGSKTQSITVKHISRRTLEKSTICYDECLEFRRSILFFKIALGVDDVPGCNARLASCNSACFSSRSCEVREGSSSPKGWPCQLRTLKCARPKKREGSSFIDRWVVQKPPSVVFKPVR